MAHKHWVSASRAELKPGVLKKAWCRYFVFALLAFAVGCGALRAQDLVIRRFEGSQAFAFQQTGIREPERLVVRDSETWKSLWDRVHSNRRPVPALPSVDFSRDMLLFAALGRKPTGGFEIRIDTARIDETGMVVDVSEQEPGSGCAVSMALTAPVDIAIVPRYPGNVSFESHRVTTTC